jgi:calcineurin-like phosphoesterase family protein
MKFDSNRLFFVSDTHFRHNNVPKFDKSPFWSERAQELDRRLKDKSLSDSDYKRIRNEEYAELQNCIRHQDEEIIKNWNSVVSNDDTVFHLGDVTFSNDPKDINGILDRLNGKIILINGNHEQGVHKNQSVKNRFSLIRDYMEISVDNQRITMLHYPIHEWNQAHRGAWMLHGHTHIHDDYDTKYKRCNVGIMNWNYYPASFKQLQIFMADKVNKEHH